MRMEFDVLPRFMSENSSKKIFAKKLCSFLLRDEFQVEPEILGEHNVSLGCIYVNETW